MVRGNFVLGTEMLQCVMVGVKHEFLVKQLMSPTFDSLYDCIELYIICAIAKTTARDLLIEGSYRTLTLTK